MAQPPPAPEAALPIERDTPGSPTTSTLDGLKRLYPCLDLRAFHEPSGQRHDRGKPTRIPWLEFTAQPQGVELLQFAPARITLSSRDGLRVGVLLILLNYLRNPSRNGPEPHWNGKKLRTCEPFRATAAHCS